MTQKLLGTTVMPDTTAVARRSAGPFLKWAGGKSQLLPRLRQLFPAQAGTFFEPFLGSAAVFFGIGVGTASRSFVLSDINEHLINAYLVVRSQPDTLIDILQRHASAHSREHYYSVRARGLGAGTEAERAGTFIYLNRTCFNGLFRLNRRGEFNVPMGRYQNPRICDPTGLRLASGALRGVDIRSCGYREATSTAKPGDFVYFDPPYDPISSTASFTSYTAAAFGRYQQEELAATISDLTKRGVLVALSNSDTPFVRNLYGGDYRIVRLEASRRINSKAESRGPVGEVVVLNY